MKRALILLLICAVLASTLPLRNARADFDSVTATTSLYGSSYEKRNNINLAADALSYVTMDYGDTFSFNNWVGPREKWAGYLEADNGRGVSYRGGGVAQVATTLYLALLQMDDIEYNSLYTYGSKFTDTYVDDGNYAVLVDYANQIDFAFTSYYPGTLSIFIWTDDYDVTCLISMDDGYTTQNGNGMIGYATTPLYGSDAKINNISLASDSIFGVTLESYDMFSFNTLVGPRLKQYGYRNAINGRGVTVVGGGVAQVASTIYLAVKDLYCVSIADKRVYTSFTESYVNDPDAAILTDYTNGIDFSFYYTGYDSLELYTYISDGEVVCEVYEN